MSEFKPLRCRSCGKHLGYISVYLRTTTPWWRRFHKIDVIGRCSECHEKEQGNPKGEQRRASPPKRREKENNEEKGRSDVK